MILPILIEGQTRAGVLSGRRFLPHIDQAAAFNSVLIVEQHSGDPILRFPLVGPPGQPGGIEKRQFQGPVFFDDIDSFRVNFSESGRPRLHPLKAEEEKAVRQDQQDHRDLQDTDGSSRRCGHGVLLSIIKTLLAGNGCRQKGGPFRSIIGNEERGRKAMPQPCLDLRPPICVE